MDTLTPDTETSARTVTFDAWRLPVFQAKVADLNKRASRLGLPPIVTLVAERGTRTSTESPDLGGLGYGPVTYEVETITVVIEGSSPVLPGGWRVLGVIEHLHEGEHNGVPGNQYGTSYLVVMVDGAGNRIKTWASGAFGYQAEAGWAGTIKATVKAHETYEGRRETLVTRVAIVSGSPA